MLKFNKKARSKNARKGEGKGNIERDPAGVKYTEGVLYTISSDGLAKLDQKEGYPADYEKGQVDVKLDDGSKVKARVYIARPEFIREGLKPTKDYLRHYLKGKDLLSPAYYQWLEETETLD